MFSLRIKNSKTIIERIIPIPNIPNELRIMIFSPIQSSMLGDGGTLLCSSLSRNILEDKDNGPKILLAILMNSSINILE
jgi:hypothetical protein